MLAREQVAEAFGPGTHATTFGGTPLVTAAALEVCKTLVQGNVISQGCEAGEYFKEKLLWLKERHDVIADVRGVGLLLGIKLAVKGESIVNQCLQRGFLINCIQENILRFVPPLIIKKKEIDSLIGCLDEIFTELSDKSQHKSSRDKT
jgi:acetylornithine/succinyldiaminopimelate/putrescine aminotransferase